MVVWNTSSIRIKNIIALQRTLKPYEKLQFYNFIITESWNLPQEISAQNKELKIYQFSDKHQNLSVQFEYLLIIQEIRAN